MNDFIMFLEKVTKFIPKMRKVQHSQYARYNTTHYAYQFAVNSTSTIPNYFTISYDCISSKYVIFAL